MNQLPSEVSLHLMKGLSSGHKQASTPARIDCPECGAHLSYPDRSIQLDPPRKRVECPVCEYRGFVRLKEIPQGVDPADVELDGPLHIPICDG